jgi:hypothetical protein
MATNTEFLPDTTSQVDPTLFGEPGAESLVELRNQALGAILDPEGTLPTVILSDRYERSPRQNQTSGADNHNYAITAADGNIIGRAVVKTPYGKKAEREGFNAKVDVVEILDTTYKGRGLGKATYLEILKDLPDGFELDCDPRGVSPDAIKMWQWLESRGLAERPAELGEPELGVGEDGKPTYADLGYKTCLNKLTEFAAVR